MGTLIPKPYDWNVAMMEVAFIFSKMSKDPSTQVGAVVVSPDRTSMSAGYNGFPTSIPDRVEWWENRDSTLPDTFCKYDLVSHAEENAVSQARTPIEGWTIYVTHFPCLRCARMLVREKVARVFYCYDQARVNMTLDSEKVRWLLAIANIELQQLTID